MNNKRHYADIYSDNGDDENKSLLSESSLYTSQELEECGDANAKNKVSMPSPVITTGEIVELIINTLKESDLYHLTCWDSMKFVLENTITNIHSHNYEEYLKYFVTYKYYNDSDAGANTNIRKYGMFKHKYANIMFRIDDIEDQFLGENIVHSKLLEKYNNNYKDIIKMGIMLPVYCHIKYSNPQLFYSVQPFITAGSTLDVWIESIQHKGNFDEIVYDVFIQLVGILKELHEVECVHGDIKPSNILIIKQKNMNMNNVRVFLIDFGLSGIHEKTTNASGGTLPFCAPETANTNANTKNGNDVIKCPQHFNYNWVKHKKSHDIWSLGIILITIYIFKNIKLFYDEYPSDFFTSTGYIAPKYFNMVKHEYIREMLSEHILVEPSKRCDVFQLSSIVSNLAFM